MNEGTETPLAIRAPRLVIAWKNGGKREILNVYSRKLKCRWPELEGGRDADCK